MLQKRNSLKVSERVFDLLTDYVDFDIYDGMLDTFNNCRETGLMLSINRKDIYDKNLWIWVFENRNSDNIVVIYTNNFEDREINNMFSQNAYNNKKLFHYDQEREACKYIKKLIQEELD